MWPVFWRVLKDRKISLLIYCLAAIGFLWMYIALFPAIQSQAEQLQKLIETYPKSFLDAFGFESAELAFGHLENYLATEMFSMIWPIMLMALLIAQGGSAIAGEIEKGTIEIVLSQPASRLKIFLGKYLSGVAALFIFTTVTVAAVFPLAAAYNVDYKLANFVTMGALGFLFGLTILSMTMMFSAIFSEKGRVYFLSAGILVVMYVVNIISALKDNLENLKYFSFFHYYDTAEALTKNHIDNLTILVFLGVAIVCTALAALWFKNRDIAVS